MINCYTIAALQATKNRNSLMNDLSRHVHVFYDVTILTFLLLNVYNIQ